MASSREILSDGKEDDNDEDLESLRLAALLSMKSGSHTYPILKPYRPGQALIRTQTFNQRKHTFLKRRGLLNQKSHRRSNLIVIQPSSNISQNPSFANNILLIEEKKAEEKKEDRKGPSRFSRVNDSSDTDSEMSDICDNSGVSTFDVNVVKECSDVLNDVITKCEKLSFNQKCSAAQCINIQEEELDTVNTKHVCANLNSSASGSEDNSEMYQYVEKMKEPSEEMDTNCCSSSDELNLTFHVKETLDEFVDSPCSLERSPKRSNQGSDLEEGELADDDLIAFENRSEGFSVSGFGNSGMLNLSADQMCIQKSEIKQPNSIISSEATLYPDQLENSSFQHQSAGLSSSSFDCSPNAVKNASSECPSNKAVKKLENWQSSKLEEKSSFDVQLPKREKKQQENEQSDCSSEEYDFHKVYARDREIENDEIYGSDTILADDDLRHSLLRKQMSKKKDFFKFQHHERSRSRSQKDRKSSKSRSQHSRSDSRSQHSRSDRSRSQHSHRSRSQENLLNRKEHRETRIEMEEKRNKLHRSRSNSTSSYSSEEKVPKTVSSIVKSVQKPLQFNIKNTDHNYFSTCTESLYIKKELGHTRKHSSGYTRKHSSKKSSKIRRVSSSSSASPPRRRSSSRTRVPVKHASKSRVPSLRQSRPKSQILSKRHESRSPKPSSRAHLPKSRVSSSQKSTSESRILKRSDSPDSDGSRGNKNDTSVQPIVLIRHLDLKQKRSVSSETSRPSKVSRDAETSSHSSGSQKTSKNRHKKKSKGSGHSKRDKSSKKKSHH